MSSMGPQTRLRELLALPAAREALTTTFPAVEEVLDRLEPVMDHSVSVGLMLAGISKEQMAPLWPQLATIQRPAPRFSPAIAPDHGIEGPGVRLGSASVDVPPTAQLYKPLDLRLSGPTTGNPFVDVELWAELTDPNGKLSRVGGFYDGEGTYVVRFLPGVVGTWEFVVHSTARSLEGVHGSVSVAESAERGPVSVADTFAFAYANGDPYIPIGTTAYAWTHQGDRLEEETLRTLAEAPFTKLRMCVFPKHYDWNNNEPERYPFARGDEGFDFARFDPEYWRHLEGRLRELDQLGIQADLILFHPYDGWGFADMGPAVDERYVRYLVRRLAAFPNVWWSLANEYDFVWTKDLADWHRFAAIIGEEDHVGHLMSIHNGVFLFDNSAPWVTHCSIQRDDSYKTTEKVLEWRAQWGKPVIVDEMGYEGDVEWDWGHLPATELVRRFWEATIRGGYATHGETYWNAEEELFWSKGGKLVGQSQERIAFVSRLIAESPTGRLEPMRTGFQGNSAGVPGAYELHYLGFGQPRVLTVTVPPGATAEIDVIDTWEMTLKTLPGTFEGAVGVDLPSKPYQAVRVRVMSA